MPAAPTPVRTGSAAASVARSGAARAVPGTTPRSAAPRP
jgi:hypothetical protein